MISAFTYAIAFCRKRAWREYPVADAIRKTLQLEVPEPRSDQAQPFLREVTEVIAAVRKEQEKTIPLPDFKSRPHLRRTASFYGEDMQKFVDPQRLVTAVARCVKEHELVRVTVNVLCCDLPNPLSRSFKLLPGVLSDRAQQIAQCYLGILQTSSSQPRSPTRAEPSTELAYTTTRTPRTPRGRREKVSCTPASLPPLPTHVHVPCC